MTFHLLIDRRALGDIQDAIDYYESVQAGFGDRFESHLNDYLQTLTSTPYFQTRYDNIRCLPLKSFPYTVHFTVDEADKMIIVWSVFHMAEDPKQWKRRK